MRAEGSGGGASGQPAGHGGRYIPRDRLLAPLLASHVALIEAGAGYGKSVLAHQYRQALGAASAYVPLGEPDDRPAILCSSLHRALREAHLSDLSSAVEEAEPSTRIDRLLDALVATDASVLLAFDDAHHLRMAGAELVMRLARGLPAQHRLLIAGRRLAGPLEHLRISPDTILLDTRALTFTADEAAKLIERRWGYRLPDQDVRVLVETSRGWATALVVAAGTYGSEAGAQALHLPSGSDLAAAALGTTLQSLGHRDAKVLVQLAHLPLISPELCRVLGGSGSTFERIIDAGVPLVRTDSGWWELPGPVADYLSSQEPLARATVLTAADVYRRAGQILESMRVLLGTGEPTQAAAVLAQVSPDVVDDLGLSVIRDVVEALPEAATRAHPEVLLHLARVAETAHQAELREQALSRAARLIPQNEPDAVTPLARQLAAEQARDLLWDERTRKQARELAERVIEQAGEGELVARARALDVLGRLASWWSDNGPQPEAEHLLGESARLARRLGHRIWAAQALVPLAMGYQYALCRYERALAVLDDALADLPARNRYRALVLSFRAEVLGEIGRYVEAEGCLAEMREIGRICGEEWVLAYASWSEANLASFQQDRPRTVAAVVDVEQHRDDWFEQPSGVEFLSMASDDLDRVGEPELAREYLRRARERMSGTERPVVAFGAAVLGRSGDPVEAEEAIVAALDGQARDPQERWPLMLLRAHAALRRGDDDAGRLAAEAFDTCRELGHPEGPLLRERAATEELLPLAVAAGSRAAQDLLARRGTLSIRLLGRFEVTRAGLRLDVPAGRPATAVRAVAVTGGRMHAEELIELLWPNAEVATGRARLRNLLGRLREACGDVLRREQEIIVVAEGAEIDTERFESKAEAALEVAAAGDSRRAEVLARSALARYHGALLPDDRYEQWAAEPRERLTFRYLEILDLLSAAAQQRGEVDEAARLLERAMEVQPLDEQRYLALARLLASQGRAGSALGVLRRARTALAELQIEPSGALDELARDLGLPPLG